MIKGYNFENQLSDADIDSMMYRKMLNDTDGIVKGLALFNTNSNITAGEGIAVIAGKIIAIVGSETIDIDLESAYCKLILEIDLTKESTETEFKQVNLKILKSANSYPSLTQQDMGNGGTVYQFELAKFKTSSSGISDFVDTRTFLNFEGIYEEIRQKIEEVENGSIYALKENFDNFTAKLQYCKKIQLHYNNPNNLQGVIDDISDITENKDKYVVSLRT